MKAGAHIFLLRYMCLVFEKPKEFIAQGAKEKQR